MQRHQRRPPAIGSALWQHLSQRHASISIWQVFSRAAAIVLLGGLHPGQRQREGTLCDVFAADVLSADIRSTARAGLLYAGCCYRRQVLWGLEYAAALVACRLPGELRRRLR